VRVTLDLTVDEAVILRDAIVDKYIALRSDDRGVARREADFLADPEISDRRKRSYQTLRDYAEVLRSAINNTRG
jgi:hypothetical protein